MGWNQTLQNTSFALRSLHLKIWKLWIDLPQCSVKWKWKRGWTWVYYSLKIGERCVERMESLFFLYEGSDGNYCLCYGKSQLCTGWALGLCLEKQKCLALWRWAACPDKWQTDIWPDNAAHSELLSGNSMKAMQRSADRREKGKWGRDSKVAFKCQDLDSNEMKWVYFKSSPCVRLWVQIWTPAGMESPSLWGGKKDNQQVPWWLRASLVSHSLKETHGWIHRDSAILRATLIQHWCQEHGDTAEGARWAPQGSRWLASRCPGCWPLWGNQAADAAALGAVMLPVMGDKEKRTQDRKGPGLCTEREGGLGRKKIEREM